MKNTIVVAKALVVSFISFAFACGGVRPERIDVDATEDVADVAEVDRPPFIEGAASDIVVSIVVDAGTDAGALADAGASVADAGAHPADAGATVDAGGPSQSLPPHQCFVGRGRKLGLWKHGICW